MCTFPNDRIVFAVNICVHVFQCNLQVKAVSFYCPNFDTTM